MSRLRALLATLPNRPTATPDEVRPGLSVGDEAAARACGDRFDRVVSVAEGLAVATTTHSVELTVDESVLDRADGFAAAIEAVRAARRDGESVLVHCYEGRERAPTVAAAALAADSAADFEDALATVRDVRPVVNPTPPLVEVARRYLDEPEESDE